MTKKELLELVDGVSAALALGLASMKTAENDGGEQRMIEKVREHGMWFEGPTPPGERVGIEGETAFSVFSNPGSLNIVKGNFVFILRSALARFGYEAILLYCKTTGHQPLMKTEPWCDYARVVRNTVSHGTHTVLNQWPDEWQAPKPGKKPKKSHVRKTSVVWRHRTINETEVGKEIEFTLYDAWRLYLDMREFIEKRLP
jgi:hypothetical protein